MAAPSLTYTLTNGTTADASQVMQDFNDLLNGVTDGTKDLTIAGLTCTGNVSFQGNVTLGNGSVDDLTVSASLASSIPVKTNNSFDFGSATLGLAGVYLGAAGGFTTRLKAAATASWTLTLPVGAGSAGQKIGNTGSGSTAWVNSGSSAVENLGLTASVATNALTIAIKGADGNDPSSSNPVYITFRNATATTGTPVVRTITSATSVVVTAGATLGHVDALDQYVWVYAIDNAGTVELAVSGVKLFNDGSIASTSGVGTGSDDGATLYSTSSRSNVAIRLIGRLKANQATAGTWATAISEVTLDPKPSVTMTDWVDYTPTGAWSSNVTYYGSWRRVGSDMEVRARVTLSGTTTATTFTLSIPSGAIDAGAYPNNAAIQYQTPVDGVANAQDSGAGVHLNVAYNTSTSITLLYQSTTLGVNTLVSNTTPTTWNTGDSIDIYFKVPITGWSVYGP